MSSGSLLRFRHVRKPTAAKASLRDDVRSSVDRSIRKLPALGLQNPDAALLVERSIDDWMPQPNGGHERAVPARAATAAHATPRRRHKPVLADQNVWKPDPLLIAAVTEAWDVFIKLKVGA